MKRDLLIGKGAKKIEEILRVEADLHRFAVVIGGDGLFALAGFRQRGMDVQLAFLNSHPDGAGPLIGKLRDALDGLADDYREVIVLRNLECLTFPQIAERLGRSVDSVEKLWLRGLTSLRRLFGDGS